MKGLTREGFIPEKITIQYQSDYVVSYKKRFETLTEVALLRKYTLADLNLLRDRAGLVSLENGLKAYLYCSQLFHKTLWTETECMRPELKEQLTTSHQKTRVDGCQLEWGLQWNQRALSSFCSVSHECLGKRRPIPTLYLACWKSLKQQHTGTVSEV